MGGIEAALAEHAFGHLFIECLGWDRVRAEIVIEHPHGRFELAAIAQKRGFTAFLTSAHRTVLANRRLLRDVQLQLRKSHHEHILIHCCETPRKQVWQWATKIENGRGILHREHPFFSNVVPPRLLSRIEGLAVSFEEEEQTRLPDVLLRVRTALMPDSDLKLFAKRPSYAAQSDRLAMAMKGGEPGAFAKFVVFHTPLAKHASRMLVHWFEMDTDDAQQTAMIGLIEAARRFDPDRGYQFSTYAHYWLRQICQRYGLAWGLPIRLPPHWFWPCYRLLFKRTELIATYGEHDAEAYFEKELDEAGVPLKHWESFTAARQMGFFSDMTHREQTELGISSDSLVIDRACGDELRNQIRHALNSLAPRRAQILRLRYGIDEKEHTLQEVAEILGITRERVRQIQVVAEEKLVQALGQLGISQAEFGERVTVNENPAEEVVQ